MRTPRSGLEGGGGGRLKNRIGSGIASLEGVGTAGPLYGGGGGAVHL